MLRNGGPAWTGIAARLAPELWPGINRNTHYLPYRSKTVTKAYEIGGYKNGQLITEVTEDHTVNTFGNSTFVSVKVEDKDAGSAEVGSVWRTEVTSTFSEHLNDWCIALPLTRSEKRILPDGTFDIRTANWDVLTLECRVTKETIEPGAGDLLSLVTDIGYDSCGNVNSVSSYPAGTTGQQRTTTIGYGSRCQRPESITNPENHASTISYNWPLALPSSVTDPNGITAAMLYDGFGRLIQRDNPDGTDLAFTLTACTAGNSWCGKNSAARIKVSRAMRDTANATIRTDEQFLDGFGRVHWSHSDSLESGPSIIQTDYDAFGRPSAQSQPHFLGGTIYPTTYTRDLIGRVTQVNAPISTGSPTGRITALAYEGRDLKVTDPKTNITTRRSNVIGQPRSVIDPAPGGTTSYSYHPFGELASITDAASNITSWNINVRGFATGTTDPDSGSWTYQSNAFGETEYIRDAKTSSPNWTTQFTFDKLSRPLTRVENEGTTTFIYGVLGDNTATNKYIGRLKSVTSPSGYVESYLFDELARLARLRTTIEGVNYDFHYQYIASNGLLNTIRYPLSTGASQFKIQYQYDHNLVRRVKEFGGTTTYWEGNSTDAWGHYQDEIFGNGVVAITDFDQANGLMLTRTGGVGGGTGLIHSTVDWDLNGNLKQRQDLKLSPNVTEDFYYDSLNRFDYSNRTAGGSPAINADVTLDAIGNINWKLGVGSYTYDATQKRAVTAAGSNSYDYDANGNMTSRNGSSISYTSYNLPGVINAGAGYSSTLSYGAFRNRFKQIAVTPTGTETTVYIAGLMEKVTRGSSTEYRHLIQGGQGAAAIHTRVVGGASSTYYLHRDHLGSPELITDSSGLEVVRPSFGAYGERRDGTDWSGPPSAADLTDIANLTRRGFTGHEHLDAVTLIHMNGRVYEPVAGRFLGVDPIVHVGLSQSPNSYSYVWNNPLTLTDPSGFTVDQMMNPLPVRVWIDYVPIGRPPAGDGWEEPITREYDPGAGPVNGGQVSGPVASGGWDGTVGGRGVMYGINATPTQVNRAFLQLISRLTELVVLTPEQQARNRAIFYEVAANTLEYGGYALIAFDIANTVSVVAAGPDTSLIGTPLVGLAATLRAFAARGDQATRSSLQIGQQMHRVYKSDLVDGVTRFKEFRFNTGRRADFIDFERGTIYELKPNNPRGIREGYQQLEQYLRDAQAQFPGINWHTVLDTY